MFIDTGSGSIPEELDIDTVHNHIYWVDRGNRAIYRADLVGTNIITILDDTYIDTPYGIRVDTVNNKIYWSQQEFYTGEVKGIFKADVDGTNREQFSTPGIVSPSGIDYVP